MMPCVCRFIDIYPIIYIILYIRHVYVYDASYYVLDIATF